jgi:hypothetical protein
MAAINQVSVSGGGSAAANTSDGTNIVGATSNCLTITIRPQTAVANGATVSPANQCYTNPTLVDVIAYNVGGYTFSSFSGGLTGTSNNQTVMVSGSVNITAHFNTSFTLSPANQNANIAIPTNGTPVPATYHFSTGDPQCISTCGVYDSSGNLSQYVTATITQRTASSLSLQYTAAPGAQLLPVEPICPCYDGGCDPVPLPPGDPTAASLSLFVNGTADTSDDITVLSPAQTIPIEVTLSGASGTVTLTVTPSGRASLSQSSLNLTDGQPATVTLTPLAASQAVNDVQITATSPSATSAQGNLTIVNVVIPTVTSYAATASGVPYHVPPGVSVQVPVTVEPDLTGSRLTVTLAALGTSNVNNGTFTIDGAATESVVSSKTVNVTGGTQTAETPAPGGGNANQLFLAAQVRGQTTVQSNGFSVAALPDGVLATYDGEDAAFPTWVGFVDLVSLSSDSESIGDLDQVQFAETLGTPIQTGSLSNQVLGPASGYFAAISGQSDEHTTNVTSITSQTPGSITVSQIWVFSDLRTGVYNVPIYGSGYLIVKKMDCPPTIVTSYACSFTTSLTGAAVSVGNNPLVLAGATSPSPMSLTQEVQK